MVVRTRRQQEQGEKVRPIRERSGLASTRTRSTQHPTERRSNRGSHHTHHLAAELIAFPYDGRCHICRMGGYWRKHEAFLIFVLDFTITHCNIDYQPRYGGS
jgi:hypothetical protein